MTVREMASSVRERSVVVNSILPGRFVADLSQVVRLNQRRLPPRWQRLGLLGKPRASRTWARMLWERLRTQRRPPRLPRPIRKPPAVKRSGGNWVT
jgi:hypothetical protein